jgi:hypothetical protein
MADIGTVLFVLAFIVTFMYPRIAVAIGLASSLLCLPLYLHFMTPVPFNQVFGFGHQFKVRPSGGLHYNQWATGGVLTLAIAIYLSFAALQSRAGRRLPL